MTTYIYLTNRKIVTDSEGIVIESNASTHPVGEKVSPKWLKTVGYKKLKNGKRTAIKVKD